MPKPRLWLYDRQAVKPVGYCAVCDGEIYSEEEGELCRECRREEELKENEEG